MAATARNAQQQSAAASLKAERELDKAAAMQEYEAERVALQARTERLRALRLAKEAEAGETAAQQAAPDAAPPAPVSRRPARRAAKRV